MRISAELLALAEQRTNPLGERELILQGLGITVIENMGAARDEFDAWDLSCNRIIRLENLPRLQRLSNLLLCGNLIETIDANNMLRNIPNITSLILSHNQISSLVEVANIGKGFSKLEFLSLVGNPVTRRQYYRLYTIHKIPTLKSLDFHKVKPAEREKARRLAKSVAGAALESDLQVERDSTSTLDVTKTFIPGEELLHFENDQTNSTVRQVFTAEQKQQIRELLEKASTIQEFEEIENSVRKGVLPDALNRIGITDNEQVHKKQKIS